MVSNIVNSLVTGWRQKHKILSFKDPQSQTAQQDPHASKARWRLGG